MNALITYSQHLSITLLAGILTMGGMMFAHKIATTPAASVVVAYPARVTKTAVAVPTVINVGGSTGTY
jgi:hypothetical protein